MTTILTSLYATTPVRLCPEAFMLALERLGRPLGLTPTGNPGTRLARTLAELDPHLKSDIGLADGQAVEDWARARGERIG